MMGNVPGPNAACGVRITLSSRCISRLANLNGLVTRMHSLTPGRTSSNSESTTDMFPVMPIAVRVLPGSGCGVRFCARIASSTDSICSGVASLCITTSMDNSDSDRARRVSEGEAKTLAYASGSNRDALARGL